MKRAWAALAAACLARAAPVVNFTTTYLDGSTLRVELVAADGSIVRAVVIPKGANESFLRYPLTVPQPPLPPNATFVVSQAATYTLLTTPASIVNVSKLEPIAQLLSPAGALLSGEPQPVSAQPESQCGNGHGGPIAGGCLRSWRTLQAGERIWGFGMQSFSVDHSGTTVWIATDGEQRARGDERPRRLAPLPCLRSQPELDGRRPLAGALLPLLPRLRRRGQHARLLVL